MASEIDVLIERLRGANDVTAACATVDEWARVGRVSDLMDLASAIEAVGGALRKRGATGPELASEQPDPLWPYEAVADQVEEALALTPGDDRIDALFALASRDRVASVRVARPQAQRARAFASRLGFAHKVEGLVAALARYGSRPEHVELLACWMHELVLRGGAVGDRAELRALQAALADRKHALGALPLALWRVEAEAPSYMPMYGDLGLARAVAQLENGPMSLRTIPPPAGAETFRPMRIEDPALERRIAEAARPWTERSSGRSEAKVFSVAPPVLASSGKALLRALPLECLAGASRVEAAFVQASAVFGTLFAAAANGGAYSSGFGGAYGRLAAWRSYGALVGAPEDAAIDEIETRGAACAFLSFGADSDAPWFHGVAWDFGLACVRDRGATVAVLAATDTD